MKNQPKNAYFLTPVTFTVVIGGFLFGYDTAVISGTISSLQSFFISPRQLDPSTADSLLGFAVSSALLGCALGGFLGGWLSGKIGRRNGLLVAAILFLISALGSSMPEFGFQTLGQGDHQSLHLFIMYRVMGGVGIGLASMLSPAYIAEIAPSAQRGKLVSYNQMAIVTGIFIVYFINYFIAAQGDQEWLNSVGWRWMFASEAIPAFIFLTCLLFIPDTPRSLILRQKPEESKSVLHRIYPDVEAIQIYDDINHSLSQNQHKPLFSYGKKLVIVGVLLAIVQQCVGINAVLYYAPEIFKSMGDQSDGALLQTISVGAINFLFTFIAIYTVDSWGRKSLMIWGGIGMATFMIGLGSCFYLSISGSLVLFFMLAYVACFAMSWGPVTWVLLSEIFPNTIRNKALGLAVAAMWIANQFISWSFPLLNNQETLVALFNHGFTYWIYGAVSLLGTLFIWKYIPETKGKSLEMVERYWTTTE